MHHRRKDPDALAAENRGEPYYNEPDAGRFGEPRGRGHSNAIERGADHASASAADEREPRYPRGSRPPREPEYDPAHQRGAYYYGPRGDEDRRDSRYRADDDRYAPYGRDLGANGTRPAPYSGYAETQGHSARGAENYRGRGPKGYVRSDARILEDVSEQLTDDDRVDASDVTVTATSGVVTLDGTVPRRWMKHCAEDIAEGCGGVTDVVNRLSVRRENSGGNAPARPTDDSGKKH